MQRLDDHRLSGQQNNTLPPTLDEKKLGDNENNTPLHHAIRCCTDPKDIRKFIELADKNLSSVMARTVNNHGKLPIDLVKDTKLNNDEKKILYSILTPITSFNPFQKKLSDAIDAKVILSKYNFSYKSEVYRNIEFGCDIANITRKYIKESSTHPQINSNSKIEKEILAKKIHKLRSKQPTANYKEFLKMVLTTHPVHLLFDTTNTLFNKNAILPIKKRCGNCREMAMVAYRMAKKINPHLYVNIYHIVKGDHAILLIGKGINTVVCDPWSGDVYPFYEINSKLKNYRYYQTVDGSYLNVITEYNPRFYSLEPMRFYDKTIMAGAGIVTAATGAMLLSKL